MRNNILISILICLVLFGFSVCDDKDSGLFPETGVEGGSQNLSAVRAGFLPLPPDYNKLVIPLGNISTSIYCVVYLSIREILDVDNENEIVELDTEIQIQWMDWVIWDYLVSDDARMKAVEKWIPMGTDEEITLDAQFLKHIWKPDLFIEEMASVERTALLTQLVTLEYLIKNPVLPGSISFTARQTFKVRCNMEFKYYPADIQECDIHIRSYSYPEDKIFMVWNPRQKVFLDQTSDPNHAFEISNVEPGEELNDLYTTSQAKCCNHRNFSTLAFKLRIRRDLTYHTVQTCLPSVLLVFITWLCFLLPPDMIEARIGVSMTTVLTLTALFAAVREQAPSVSYVMAIDIWMVFCIFFLFVALLIFTVLYWMRRKLEAKQEEKEKGKDEELGRANSPRRMSQGGITTLGDEHVEHFETIVEHIRRYTFIIFALTFIIFLIAFPAWLLTSSEYFDWDPNEKYNAMEDGPEEDRLFAQQADPFGPEQKSKTPESYYRFYDIQKDIVQPRLRKIAAAKAEREEQVNPPEEAVKSAPTLEDEIATTPPKLDEKGSQEENTNSSAQTTNSSSHEINSTTQKPSSTTQKINSTTQNTNSSSQNSS